MARVRARDAARRGAGPGSRASSAGPAARSRRCSPRWARGGACGSRCSARWSRCALLGGGWMWLRHSSFVAVEHVRITGAHGQPGGSDRKRPDRSGQAPEHARRQHRAARWPPWPASRRSPRSTSRPAFPHAMRIAVVERTPVAALLVGGTRIAVGADGTALGAGVATASLPTVADDVAPPSGERTRNPLVLEALTVLGAAPHVLTQYVKRARTSRRAASPWRLRNGLLVYFGDASRPHAKWLALAAVLAQPSSAGRALRRRAHARTGGGRLRPGLRAARRRRVGDRRSADGQERIDGLRAGRGARSRNARRP